MKRYFLLNLLFLCCSVAVQAQVIKNDNTEVLDDIRGEASFTLNEGAAVYSYEPDGSWYKIRKEVVVRPDEVIDDQFLPAGTELKDEDGNVVGKVLKNVEIQEGTTIKSFRGKDSYAAILEGFVFKTKFRDGSIPEVRLSEILAMKNRTQQQEAFRELSEMYGFEERQFEDLTAHVYREENKTVAEEKDFRLIMLFRGGTTPYAVITNGHSITAEKIKDETENGPYTITYFYKPSPSQKELIEDRILYTYLAL